MLLLGWEALGWWGELGAGTQQHTPAQLPLHFLAATLA